MRTTGWLATKGARCARTPIGQIMRRCESLRTIGPDRTLWEALNALQEADVNQLPVVDDRGRWVGVLAREQLLAVIKNQLELGRR